MKRNSQSSAPLRIVVSGDTNGWLTPCGCTANQSGGLLRRATYISELRESNEVAVLDVGGAVDGDAPYQIERFKAILRGEKLMGILAHNIGSPEAALGIANLKQLADETGVRFISANAFCDDGQRVFDSHILLNQSDKKILVVGVLSQQYSTDEISVKDPQRAILEITQDVGDFDKLIILAYLPTDELRELANSLPESDVIIGGPTGQALQPELVGRVSLSSATNKGKFLITILIPDVSEEEDRNGLRAEIVELSPQFADDDHQRENLNRFREILTKRDFTAAESGFSKSPAVLAQSNDSEVAGSSSCRKCHAGINDHWTHTGHAHAWDRLKQLNAHVDSYCQQCHTTGYGQPGGFVSRSLSADRVDVGCESCHGPSKQHVKDPQISTAYDAVGQCLKCHDPENSPSFVYPKYWEKIFHD